MVLGREVRHRVGHHERLDVLHPGVARGHEHADVGVDAGDDDLVATLLAQALQQIGADESAVLPLGEHGVARVGCDLVRDGRQVLVGRESGAPEVLLETALLGALAAGLSGVEHRHAEPGRVLLQLRHIRQEFGHGRGPAVVRRQEVVLQIVDEEHRTRGVDGPVDPVGGQLVGGRHGVGGDGGQSHGGEGSVRGVVQRDGEEEMVRAAALRRSFLETLPTPVCGKASTNSTRSGTL